MINWNDPDYAAAGHFYATIQSINITCSDPTTPAADITSYVYGQNASSLTPAVNFSNASTVSGAMSTLSGVTGPWGFWTLSAAVLFSLVGAALA